MTRRKRKSRRKKKKSGWVGALFLEFLAFVLIMVLFWQARSERQAESGIEKQPAPSLTEIFEQTPFENLLVHHEEIRRF